MVLTSKKIKLALNGNKAETQDGGERETERESERERERDRERQRGKESLKRDEEENTNKEMVIVSLK